MILAFSSIPLHLLEILRYAQDDRVGLWSRRADIRASHQGMMQCAPTAFVYLNCLITSSAKV
jgi:hypothetical protein